MAPISQLSETLKALAGPEHYLFTLSDLSSALPQHSRDALQLLLSRAVKRGLLQRVCRGLYMHPDVYPTTDYCCITQLLDCGRVTSTT